MAGDPGHGDVRGPLQLGAFHSSPSVLVVAMVALGTLPIWTLVVALSIPPAAKIIKLIRSAHGKHTAELALIDQMSAQVHLLFGLLLMVGLALGKLL